MKTGLRKTVDPSALIHPGGDENGGLYELPSSPRLYEALRGGGMEKSGGGIEISADEKKARPDKIFPIVLSGEDILDIIFPRNIAGFYICYTV